MKCSTACESCFALLRVHRRQLFDDAFQDELATMYRDKGKSPVPPALMAMATLVQAYLGVSDADGRVDRG